MVAEDQYDRIAGLKDKTLADLGAWSEAQLRYKPSHTAWSALEIVDHLARTDSGITKQMQRNASAPLPLGMMNQVAGRAFNLLFRFPVKVKTPAAASSILPGSPQDLAAAAAGWHRAIDELREFLGDLEAAPAGGVFRHPVAGPMSLTTALKFLETHTRHHLHQLARLRHAGSVSAVAE